jgi:hypothetical protein
MDTEVQACAALALAASGLLVAKHVKDRDWICPPSGGLVTCHAGSSVSGRGMMVMVEERSDGLVSSRR